MAVNDSISDGVEGQAEDSTLTLQPASGDEWVFTFFLNGRGHGGSGGIDAQFYDGSAWVDCYSRGFHFWNDTNDDPDACVNEIDGWTIAERRDIKWSSTNTRYWRFTFRSDTTARNNLLWMGYKTRD